MIIKITSNMCIALQLFCSLTCREATKTNKATSCCQVPPAACDPGEMIYKIRRAKHTTHDGL